MWASLIKCTMPGQKTAGHLVAMGNQVIKTLLCTDLINSKTAPQMQGDFLVTSCDVPGEAGDVLLQLWLATVAESGILHPDTALCVRRLPGLVLCSGTLLFRCRAPAIIIPLLTFWLGAGEWLPRGNPSTSLRRRGWVQLLRMKNWLPLPQPIVLIAGSRR